MEKPSGCILISVIIPVYNRENQLAKTLQSIANQTHRPIELILIDNGSQDSSMTVCQAFQASQNNEFFRVKVLQELKKGANSARNKGIANATGDYILFFDSDDIMYADFLSTTADHLVQNNYPQAIAYPSYLRFPNGKLTRRPKYYSNDAADQLFEILILTHNVCIKRTSMKNIGLWNEEIQRWQDIEFGFRVLQNVKDLVWYTGKPLYEVICHKDSISGNSYSMDHKVLYTSLMIIKSNIELESNICEKDRQLRALCFKICSLAAQIRREGNFALGKGYLQKALLLLPNSKKLTTICLLRFQFFYEGSGGRGFWRIARKLL